MATAGACTSKGAKELHPSSCCCCCTECLQELGRSLESTIAAFPSQKLQKQCKDRLLKLLKAELSFVYNFARHSQKPAIVSSSNLYHLEAIVQILQNPFINGVCALMQTLRAVREGYTLPAHGISVEMGRKGSMLSIDLVCYVKRKPAWFVVSARNPKHLSWFDEAEFRKGLHSRIISLLSAAQANPVIRPSLLILVFSRGVDDNLRERLEKGFAAKRMDICSNLQDTPEATLTEPLEVISCKSDPLHCADCFLEDEDWLLVEIDAKYVSKTLEGLSDGNCQKYCSVGGKCVAPGDRSGLIMFEIEVDHCIKPINLKGNAASQNLGARCRHSLAATYALPDKCLAAPCGSDGSQRGLDSDISGGSFVGYEANLGDANLPAFFFQMNLQEEEMSSLRKMEVVNLDTTVLIGIVSELSNGGAVYYSEMSLKGLESRFGSLSSFVKEQALLELQRPFLVEVESILRKQRPVVSQYAWDEFCSIVSVVGGVRERRRASQLLRVLRCAIVPNSPSLRLMALPETRKIQEKHKIVFGTGDNLYAPTLTSNLTFVRAAVQQGMAFAVMNHRPLALMGD